MRALYLTIAASLLIGCSATPEVAVRTVEVKIPVSVPCKVELPERPVFELDRVSVTDDLYTKGRAALVEIEQRKAYQERLEAAAAACR